MGSAQAVSRLQFEAEIRSRTHRRVRDLSLEVNDDRVVLRGRTDTYYIKQLAQEVVRELLPDIPLINAIVVAPLPRA